MYLYIIFSLSQNLGKHSIDSIHVPPLVGDVTMTSAKWSPGPMRSGLTHTHVPPLLSLHSRYKISANIFDSGCCCFFSFSNTPEVCSYIFLYSTMFSPPSPPLQPPPRTCECWVVRGSKQKGRRRRRRAKYIESRPPPPQSRVCVCVCVKCGTASIVPLSRGYTHTHIHTYTHTTVRRTGGIDPTTHTHTHKRCGGGHHHHHHRGVRHGTSGA